MLLQECWQIPDTSITDYKTSSDEQANDCETINVSGTRAATLDGTYVKYYELNGKISWRNGDEGMIKYEKGMFGNDGWVIMDLKIGNYDPNMMVQYYSKKWSKT